LHGFGELVDSSALFTLTTVKRALNVLRLLVPDPHLQEVSLPTENSRV